MKLCCFIELPILVNKTKGAQFDKNKLNQGYLKSKQSNKCNNLKNLIYEHTYYKNLRVLSFWIIFQQTGIL